MFRTIARYELGGLGLSYPVVLIDSAEEEVDDASGERIGVSVPNLEGLTAALAVARALHPARLDGSEVRFIRRAIGFTARRFAETLGMDHATLSRWENGKQTVGEWADRQVRMAAVIGLGDRVPALRIDKKAVIDLKTEPRTASPLLHVEMQILRPAGQGGCEGWDMRRAA